MSHKNKTITWYQLLLRIEKMRLGDAKKNTVLIEVNGEKKPAILNYEKNGELAYLSIE